MKLRMTHLLAALMLSAGMVFASGCFATSYQMVPADRTPAAAGEVEVAEEDENIKLEVEISHVPPPSSLGAGLRTYVVWMKPAASQQHINLGAIKIGDDRSGELETTTPYREFDLFVTAEPSAQVETPGDRVVLSRKIDMGD